MLVRIGMVESKTGPGESGELRLNLSGELAAHPGEEEHRGARPRHVGTESSGSIQEVGNHRGGQHRFGFDQHQMKADAQRRQALCPRHRIRCRRRAHHQAGGGEDAVAVGTLHRFVDFQRRAEIVGGDDEMLQCATSRRSRRKWKNSTPSRRRRFIISGLRTISFTMEAIFGARK